MNCYFCQSEIENNFCKSCNYKETKQENLEIDVKSLFEKIKNEDIILLDVRGEDEFQITKIEKSILIPIQELPKRFQELPKKEIITYCRTGVRSLQAANFLTQQGYKAKSVHGGLHAWSDYIDPKIIKY